MAARPRNPRNKDLPANLYRLDKNSFRYRHPVKGTWHGMGADKAKAVAAARKLNSLLIPSDNLVDQVMGNAKTFGEFSTYFAEEVLAARKLASNTLRQYTGRIDTYNRVWGNTPIDQITLKSINEFLDQLAPASSNLSRSLLIDIFSHAVAKGLCPDNLAASTLPKVVNKQRKRHTLNGLAAIRAVAPPWLQNAMDLAILTTQRRSDILKLKWEDIREGWMYIAQVKTTDDEADGYEIEGAGYIRIKIDSEIQTVLDRCKASNVISPFVIHHVPSRRGVPSKEKTHWTQIKPEYLSRIFKEAREKSNPYPDLGLKQQPTFHEIRAFSIYLYKQMGRDPQALAGHSNAAMTEMYASGHGIVWNDVEVGLTLPF